MRIAASLAALAALTFASSATAQPTVAPISFSPEFQEALAEDYGEREGRVLSERIATAIDRALAERGVSAGPSATIEVSLIDAQPNRPTFQQLSDRPGLSAIDSISLGGAELNAVIRGADGRVLGEVSHRRFDHTLEDVRIAAWTWSAADRAIRQFAVKVADAYAEAR